MKTKTAPVKGPIADLVCQIIEGIGLRPQVEQTRPKDAPDGIWINVEVIDEDSVMLWPGQYNEDPTLDFDSIGCNVFLRRVEIALSGAGGLGIERRVAPTKTERLTYGDVEITIVAPMRHKVGGLIVTRKEMHENCVHPQNCPINEQTADGDVVGRCTHYMADGKTCPRHGDVAKAVAHYFEYGELPLENEFLHLRPNK